jgi:hypothetical protein
MPETSKERVGSGGKAVTLESVGHELSKYYFKEWDNSSKEYKPIKKLGLARILGRDGSGKSLVGAAVFDRESDTPLGIVLEVEVDPTDWKVTIKVGRRSREGEMKSSRR